MSSDCGFYVNDGRLRTEMLLPNPVVDAFEAKLGAKVAVMSFYAPDGTRRRRRLCVIPRGHTRVVDVARIPGLPAFGQVKTHYFFPLSRARGGNRTMFHWYYPGGLTLVHEKKEPSPARDHPRGTSLRPGQGYMTLFGVPPDAPVDLYLVCLSQDWTVAEVRLRRFGSDGRDVVSDPVVVPPRGTAFVSVRQLFDDGGNGVRGPFAIDAAAYALSYYYFVHNRHDGTWQAQHL